MNTNKSWATKIKKLRTNKGLSMEDLAKDMNKTLNTHFSKQSISNYELGQPPSIETCYAFSKYFRTAAMISLRLTGTSYPISSISR